MNRFVNWISARLPYGSQRKSRKPIQTQNLRVEQLEDRLVPAAIAPTEMADLARLFPPHAGPTSLLINFDGYADEGVAPFMSVSGNRDQDIQNILFRVSEVFSPFDVKVMRWAAMGVFRPTTAPPPSSSATIRTTAAARNFDYAFTSSGNSDRPGVHKGSSHRPNSDSYDIAFVDPVFFNATTGFGVEFRRSITRAFA